MRIFDDDIWRGADSDTKPTITWKAFHTPRRSLLVGFLFQLFGFCVMLVGLSAAEHKFDGRRTRSLILVVVSAGSMSMYLPQHGALLTCNGG